MGFGEGVCVCELVLGDFVWLWIGGIVGRWMREGRGDLAEFGVRWYGGRWMADGGRRGGWWWFREGEGLVSFRFLEFFYLDFI